MTDLKMKLKPLVWEGTDADWDGISEWSAASPFAPNGEFVIERMEDDLWTSNLEGCDRQGPTNYIGKDAAEKAKAAAQAHHDATVRAMLEDG